MFTELVIDYIQICADCDIELKALAAPLEHHQVIQSALVSVRNIPNWNLVYYSQVNQSTTNLRIELAPRTVKVSFVWIHHYQNHTRYKHFIYPYDHTSDSKYCSQI